MCAPRLTKISRSQRSPWLSLLPCLLALALGACASILAPLGAGPNSASNRPNGEGYAGRGELVLRMGMAGSGGPLGLLSSDDGPLAMFRSGPKKPDRANIEVRYLGLDGLGRAVFQRQDNDAMAGHAVAVTPAPGPADPQGLVPVAEEAQQLNTRQIALDLRLTRQLRIQGKIVEVIEATPSGVVFRLY